MVVCLCAGLNEREIQGALDAGAGTLADIGRTCGAGLDCGGCHPVLQDMLCRRSCEDCPERHSLAPVPDGSVPGRKSAGEGVSP